MKKLEINKDEIPNVLFPSEDVLYKAEDIGRRSRLLQQAVVLGNAYKHKVKIVFKDVGGTKFVYTTLWFVSDMHVQLKAGTLMPINSILKVIL